MKRSVRLRRIGASTDPTVDVKFTDELTSDILSYVLNDSLDTLSLEPDCQKSAQEDVANLEVEKKKTMSWIQKTLPRMP